MIHLLLTLNHYLMIILQSEDAGAVKIRVSIKNLSPFLYAAFVNHRTK